MTGMLSWAVAASLPFGACFPVAPGVERLTAGDLALAAPVFASAPAQAVVAFAPGPGSQRVFRAPELRRLALRLGLASGQQQDFCFARRMSVLEPARVVDAMRRGLPEGRIELVDYSRGPAPEGELVFPAKALWHRSTETVWNGFVRYGNGRRFPVWAKVRVGTPPPPVVRGEKVTVEAWSGRARLELEAIAEASGAAGERVAVRNPESKKRFFARVSGKARVSVGKEAP